MDVLRTPEDRFADLPKLSYETRYLTWDGLRTAYVDVGPTDAPVALLIHGEPTWSYLYRTMIPPLLAAGFRCVAPDHIGFGRSDKVVDDSWYVIARHIERLRHLIEALDLQRISIFVQDWGGPIGLRQVVDMPERFERLAILNTWLHHRGYEYTEAIRTWRERATDSTKLGGDMPTGRIVAFTLARPGIDREAVARAYDAPFPSAEYKAGPRRFPYCIPFGDPTAGDADRQEETYERLLQSALPMHFIFGETDQVFTPEWGREWAGRMKSATFDGVASAGHFLQEEAGPVIVEIFLRRSRGA